ncbi:DUF6764 family protein [Williamsia sterculiae]|uniref:Uncharacterized protein n=1 Tax=Williamsia sterculiae TaxID=1344003 RepID=A0A1N7EYM4_9NOCA|nr:DUF6764 family protein [Williamsia sterculiae]SIR93015.1 hypothetical protein SAMN05445060_1637 [Williamsia sterculiae]
MGIVTALQKRTRARLLVLGMIGAAASVSALFGTAGTAGAAPLNCAATKDHQVEHIVGLGGCGAKAGPSSRATAVDQSGTGTAVAVATKGGNANAYNYQPNSTALSGADTGGTGYSFSTGPSAQAVSKARVGGLSLSVAGLAGQAYAGDGGVRCDGGFALAYDSPTSQFCAGSGSVWVGTPHR